MWRRYRRAMGTRYDTSVQSFVNIITTPKGGTHVAGFEQTLLKVFRRQLEVNARRLKVGTDKVDKEDLMAGLAAVVTVRLAEPQFEGQTKEVLGTAAVRAIVGRVVETELSAILTSTKRTEKAQAALLLEKVVAEMKSRISARLHRRPSAARPRWRPRPCRASSGLPLHRSRAHQSCSSSRATARSARPPPPAPRVAGAAADPGKILNVQKASVTDMLKNAECAAIIQVIGAGSGAASTSTRSATARSSS